MRSAWQNQALIFQFQGADFSHHPVSVRIKKALNQVNRERDGHPQGKKHGHEFTQGS